MALNRLVVPNPSTIKFKSYHPIVHHEVLEFFKNTSELTYSCTVFEFAWERYYTKNRTWKTSENSNNYLKIFWYTSSHGFVWAIKIDFKIEKLKPYDTRIHDAVLWLLASSTWQYLYRCIFYIERHAKHAHRPSPHSHLMAIIVWNIWVCLGTYSLRTSAPLSEISVSHFTLRWHEMLPIKLSTNSTVSTKTSICPIFIHYCCRVVRPICCKFVVSSCWFHCKCFLWFVFAKPDVPNPLLVCQCIDLCLWLTASDSEFCT